MRAFAKLLFREFASRTPFLREKYQEWEFWHTAPSFKGIYPSFAAAIARPAAGKLVGYNHEEITRIYEPGLEQLDPSDYPVLFWLQRLLPQTQTVFDLGGNIGVAYYAYRHYISHPAQLSWTVCEVPETAAAGRRLARERGELQIDFTDDRAKGDNADLYFSAGALQYLEEPFAQILRGLVHPPRQILINRVPFCDGPPFITLQNNGRWIVPYQVANQAAFIHSITALGYELVDHWKLARTLRVLGHPEHTVENYQGMYFRLNQPALQASGPTPRD